VANLASNTVSVIDGETNTGFPVSAGTNPYAVAVDPVCDKVYVVNNGSANVTILDGATNTTTTVAAGTNPYAVAVNPVTSTAYVASYAGNTVTVVEDAPHSDTRVRAELDAPAGDTTSLAQPPLTGKGVNRWSPAATTIMGVGNRYGTTQRQWDWATVTHGAGTDSVQWAWSWGTDSLVWGENFLCAVPFEDQAAITNNLGVGTPFAGNREVYPVYRVAQYVGTSEAGTPGAKATAEPSIVRAVLLLPDATGRTPRPAFLVDACGRNLLVLHTGANDVGRLTPGVYFVLQQAPAPGNRGALVARKVLIAK
jgi:YVTN family beta-propeller protein